MRRPCFHRWIRAQVLALADARAFNLRKFAAQAQSAPSPELAAALLLYAHENDCLDRLMSYVYDDALAREYAAVESHIGKRSIQRLALRGTPMRSLPETYRVFLDAYERAYHAPERIAAEKQQIIQRTQAAMLVSGTSPADLARQLNVDPGNLNAFISRGETHRLTLETARQLASACAA